MLSTALAMAAAGLGVTIVPASVARHTPYSGLRVRRLVAPVVTRRTAVCAPRGELPRLPPRARSRPSEPRGSGRRHCTGVLAGVELLCLAERTVTKCSRPRSV